MTTETSVQGLYKLFREEFVTYFERIKVEKEKAIPFIIARSLCILLPKLMFEVGNIKNMEGQTKKDLVIDTFIFSADKLYEELNLGADLSSETWDEQIRETLKQTIPSLIDTFISVEKGQVKFNKRRFVCCGN